MARRVDIAEASRTPHGVRGLKCQLFRQRPDIAQSHPSRGAWIEIHFVRIKLRISKSHPSRGAWIEIKTSWTLLSPDPVAPLTGCVD